VDSRRKGGFQLRCLRGPGKRCCGACAPRGSGAAVPAWPGAWVLRCMRGPGKRCCGACAARGSGAAVCRRCG